MCICCYASSQDKALEGCGNASTIAVRLAELEKSSWKEISLERIQASWPTRLEGFDCANNACRSLVHQGRIVDGYIYCGQKIDLDLQPNSDAGVEKSLTVTVCYSSRQKGRVLSVARSLVEASGLPAIEAATLGRQAEQNFGFKNHQGEHVGVFFSVTERGGIWTVSVQVQRIFVARQS